MKVAEKVERCRKEKESAKVKYNEALQELNRANPKYMDDMNEVSIDGFFILIKKMFLSYISRSSPGVKRLKKIV